MPHEEGTRHSPSSLRVAPMELDEAKEAAPTPRRHLAFGTLLAMAAQASPFAASLGLSLTIARLYGPSATGVLALVLNVFNVALLFTGLGLASGITYLISRREWSFGQATHQTKRLALGLGTGGALLGVLFYLLTQHSVLKGVTLTLSVVSLASLPFAVGLSFAGAIALGRDRYEAYAAIQISQSLVFLTAGVALAAAFRLTGAIIAFALANVAAAAVGWLWTRRQASREQQSVPARPTGTATAKSPLRRAVGFGLQAWTANLLQLLNYRLDLFILSAVAARSTVGVYSVAVSATAIGWVLPDALQTVLFPRVADLAAVTASGGAVAADSDLAAARAIRHAVALSLPTIVVLACIVLLIPPIYGPRFHHSLVLGFILVPGVAALGLAKVISAVTSGRGFPRYGLYNVAITMPITLALYLTLIPRLHATGAALASTASYSIAVVISIFYLRKATRIPLRTAFIPSRSDLSDYLHALRLVRARLAR